MSRILAAFAAAGVFASQAQAQSITDRFKSLFSSGSSQPAQGRTSTPSQEGLPYCPDVSIRAGASTYAVGLPGKPAAGADLRYQATITKTARECQLNAGIVTARIGIQGRIIAGPAQAPTTVDVPLRIAIVSETVAGMKPIATKAYRTQVAMTPDGSVPFTFVADDLTYPAPTLAESDSYVVYIGFDPQALTPEKPAPKKKKK